MATDKMVCMIVFKYIRTCYLLLPLSRYLLTPRALIQANFTFPLTQFSVNLHLLILTSLLVELFLVSLLGDL